MTFIPMIIVYVLALLEIVLHTHSVHAPHALLRNLAKGKKSRDHMFNSISTWRLLGPTHRKPISDFRSKKACTQLSRPMSSHVGSNHPGDTRNVTPSH
jgi:hypothetical protein